MMNKLIYAVFFMLISMSGMSQFHNEKFLRPVFNFSYENQPTRDVVDSSSTYQLGKTSLGFKMPLINIISKGGYQGGFKLTGLTAFVNADRTNLQMTFLDQQHRLNHLGGGLNFVYFPGYRILYSASIAANIFQDNYIKGFYKFRYTGFGFINYKASDVISFKVGAAYTFLYGRGAYLPIIGAVFDFTKGPSITINYPFAATVTQKLNEHSSLAIALKPDGSVYEFTNNNQFIGEDSIIQLRQQSWKLGLIYSISLSDNIKCFLDAGLVSRSNVAFSQSSITSKENFTEAFLKDGIYIRAGLAYTFGKKPQYGKKQQGVNFMLDYDVNSTDVSDNN
jgi:hypothetical protein